MKLGKRIELIVAFNLTIHTLGGNSKKDVLFLLKNDTIYRRTVLTALVYEKCIQFE